MVQTLLTENTKRKIMVISWDESDDYDSFAAKIEKSCLDRRFVGDLQIEYSYDWRWSSTKGSKKREKSRNTQQAVVQGNELEPEQKER